MTAKTKRIITIILAVLTALLSVAVVTLACILINDSDNRSDHEKYYDMKCAAYATENFNYAKGQIVFIGDSITDLYVLDDHYSDLSLATYNRGIGGDTTQGLLNRLQVSVFDVAPSKIVMMIGANDVNGNVKESKILEHYEKIIRSIYEKLPNVDLYCMSIIPMNDDLDNYTHINAARSTETIMRLNPQIQQIATSYGATYLNLFPLLADENNQLIKAYSDDGIHLNSAGLTVWTNLLKPYLQASITP